MNYELIIYTTNIQLGDTILINCSAGGWGRIIFFHILNENIFPKFYFKISYARFLISKLPRPSKRPKVRIIKIRIQCLKLIFMIFIHTKVSTSYILFLTAFENHITIILPADRVIFFHALAHLKIINLVLLNIFKLHILKEYFILQILIYYVCCRYYKKMMKIVDLVYNMLKYIVKQKENSRISAPVTISKAKAT